MGPFAMAYHELQKNAAILLYSNASAVALGKTTGTTQRQAAQHHLPGCRCDHAAIAHDSSSTHSIDSWLT